jgi:anti-sigma factor RsiW
MDCNETRRLLEADLDGELDLVRRLEIETHLRGCTACSQLAESLRARHNALRTSLPRFTAPPQLAQKIRAGIRAEATPAPSVALATPWKKRVVGGWQWGALAASVAVALFAGYIAGGARARENLLLDEAISDHVRSLQTGHLTDVISTDQHTVKPWFTGKLDFSPPVVDLAAAGFPLAGGRLEYLDGRPAAALVFHRRQHPINVFVWPARAGGIPEGHVERAGYAAKAWSQGDLNFLAVSEIPAAELADFTAAFRNATR